LPVHYEENKEANDYNAESPYKNLRGLVDQPEQIKGYRNINLSHKLKDEEINSV